MMHQKMIHQHLKNRLQGAFTALVTPFSKGQVDQPALSDLIEWQIGEGVHGFVVCGTTGEAATLSHEEWRAVIRSSVAQTRGRVPVIAGTGTNDTRKTIELTTEAASLGADAALVVTPYYNRPSQEGLFRHFEAVAQSVDLPIIVYNVPSRTGVDLTIATLERVAQLPGIVGIKDATGDLSRPTAVSAALGRRFIQFSGHDATALAFNAAGGHGAISVVSNVAPRLCSRMQEACLAGNFETARSIQRRLLPLVSALERETNPVPVKFALHLLRGMTPDVRLPMVEAMPQTVEALRRAMAFVRPDRANQPATAGVLRLRRRRAE